MKKRGGKPKDGTRVPSFDKYTKKKLKGIKALIEKTS